MVDGSQEQQHRLSPITMSSRTSSDFQESFANRFGSSSLHDMTYPCGNSRTNTCHNMFMPQGGTQTLGGGNLLDADQVDCQKSIDWITVRSVNHPKMALVASRTANNAKVAATKTLKRITVPVEKRRLITELFKTGKTRGSLITLAIVYGLKDLFSEEIQAMPPKGDSHHQTHDSRGRQVAGNCPCGLRDSAEDSSELHDEPC